MSWVLWSEWVVRSHMVVCSAWEESPRDGGENWSIALVIWSFIPQRAQALKWSFTSSVLLLSSLFFNPLSLPSDLPDPYYFHIPGRSVSLKKKESKFFICHATLSGEKVSGREVKCAAGIASVCAMGVLYGTHDGSFFQSGKQTLETRGWNLWLGGRTTAVTQILFSWLLHAFIQTLLLL